jgi:hypothetical protein
MMLPCGLVQRRGDRGLAGRATDDTGRSTALFGHSDRNRADLAGSERPSLRAHLRIGAASFAPERKPARGMPAMGQQHQFAPPKPSARYRFGKGTFAGTRGNERDAPTPDLPDPPFVLDRGLTRSGSHTRRLMVVDPVAAGTRRAHVTGQLGCLRFRGSTVFVRVVKKGSPRH